MNIDWTSESLWAAVTGIATILLVLGPLVVWVGRSIKAALTRELEPLREENRQLRADLDTRLRMPSFGLDAVRLTEISAERQIEQLEQEHAAAIEAKDRELAATLEKQINEAESLRRQLEVATAERNRIGADLESTLFDRTLTDPPHAISLPTGLILVVRCNGNYGAIQAVDQTSSSRGAMIRYSWWYNPDGGGRFTTEATECGYAVAGEQEPHRPPRLSVGPLQLPWSVGSEGVGWVYYNKTSVPPDGCEVSLVAEVDISRIDGSKLEFRKPAPDSSGRTAHRGASS